VCNGTLPPDGPWPYRLDGIQGVPKYFGDYTTLLTFGYTGNIAVTYLGSYNAYYAVVNGIIYINVTNRSTINSGTHPPIVGYTEWWSNNIGKPLNQYFSSGGPMSPTVQEFFFQEKLAGRKGC
jgi:hypothetical protein